MTVIGELAVNAVVRTEGVTRGARAMRSELGSLASFSKGTVVAAFVAMGAAATTAAARFTVAQAKIASQINQQSQRLGTSIEQLSRYQYAAEQAADMTEGALASALQRMNTNTGMAAQGTGRAQKAFQELGLSAQHLSTLPLNDRLELIADSLAKVGDRAAQTRLAEKIFGTGDIVSLLNQGADGLRQLTEESDRLGATLDGKSVQALDKADDGFARLGKVARAAKQDIAAAFAPAAEFVANELAATLNGFRSVESHMAMIRSQAEQRLTVEERVANNLALQKERVEAVAKATAKANQDAAARQAAGSKATFDRLGFDGIKGRLADTRFGNQTFGMKQSEVGRARLATMTGNNPAAEFTRNMQRELIAELEARERLEAQRDRDIAAKEREQQLDERAKSIIEEQLTPLDRLKTELAEITALHESGRLTDAQAAAAVENARKGVAGDGGPTGPRTNALVRFGSADAIKAIRESRQADKGDPEKKKTNVLLKEANKIAEDTLTSIKQIAMVNDMANWN
jgi:hypothetical protein